MSNERKIDRFDKYMKTSGLNDNKVTVDLGLSVGVIGKSRKEGRDLSDKTIESILNFYGNLNRIWLLTGEGEMLKTEAKPLTPASDNYVLLLPLSAQGGSLGEFSQSVKTEDCERIKSPVDGADFAITVSGDSMSPEYPNGSRVLVKKIDGRAFIEWGRTYVLDTCNGSVIKVLTPSKREDCVTCNSLNEDPRYAPFDVNLRDVFGIYRVLLCMAMK